MAWSPTAADVVATGGADDTAYIWRVGQEAFEQTGGAVLELSGHSDTVSALAFLCRRLHPGLGRHGRPGQGLGGGQRALPADAGGSGRRG